MEQRYHCSGYACGARLTFADGMPRRVGVDRMRALGWTILDGEAVCPSCSGDALAATLSASVKLGAAEADNDGDAERDAAGGSLSAVAARSAAKW